MGKSKCLTGFVSVALLIFSFHARCPKLSPILPYSIAPGMNRNGKYFFQFVFRELYLFSSNIHLVEFLMFIFLKDSFCLFILLFLSMYVCGIGMYMCESMFQYVHLSAGAHSGQRH